MASSNSSSSIITLSVAGTHSPCVEKEDHRGMATVSSRTGSANLESTLPKRFVFDVTTTMKTMLIIMTVVVVMAMTTIMNMMTMTTKIVAVVVVVVVTMMMMTTTTFGATTAMMTIEGRIRMTTTKTTIITMML